MAIADDLARVVRDQWRVNMLLGWQQRMGFDGGTMGRLAKAAGATPQQVQAWMDGSVTPTTQQALAVIDNLPLPAVGAAVLASANGKAAH